MSCAGVLPKTLSDKLTKILPPSMISVMLMDDFEPQSLIVTCKS